MGLRFFVSWGLGFRFFFCGFLGLGIFRVS